MAEKSGPVRIQLELPSDNERLLAGLDAWLELGLISHDQVRSLCAERLVCDRPPVPVENPFAIPEPPPETVPSDKTPPDFLPPEPEPSPRPSSVPSPVRGWVGQIVGELSVVWLLGLGVFLVVLSSAVLAATQWAAFNPVGQYLVLLAYTLIFWGVGLWSADNPHLRLTSRTLQIITLLLVPLNFWAMDALDIWPGLGVLVGIGAGVLLGAIAFRLLERWSATPSQRYLFLGLSLLQLGWSLSGWPTVAIYGGVVSCGALLLRQEHSVKRGTDWPLLLINFGLGLLLLRGMTAVGWGEWGQLGLAFGIYGAVWVWLGQRVLSPGTEVADPDPPATVESAVETESETAETNSRINLALWSRRLGQGLLIWGWLMAVDGWPFQALLVSGLGLGLRVLRQQQSPQRRNLLFGLAIALQFPFLIWQLLSPGMQAVIAAPATWLSTAEDPDLLLGIYLYPYVVGLVAIAEAYSRRQNFPMARFSEGLAVVVNTVLSAISIWAPAVLVVNLIASTVTAFATTLRRPASAWRILFTHGLALLTVLMTINHRWPGLSSPRWMLIIFGLMAANLLASRWLRAGWERSAWLYGLVLAGLAYAQLWNHLSNRGFQSGYSLLGLTIPLLMTLLKRGRWSLLAVGLTAPLTLGMATTRLIGLGSATGLSVANSYLRQRLPMLLVTVGFGLGFTISLIEDAVPGFPSRYDQWYGVFAVLAAGLWGLWRWLPQSGIAELYRTACDRWGFVLTGGLLLALSAEAGMLYLGWRAPELTCTVGILLVMGAIALRFWGQPRPAAVFLLGWVVELLGAELVAMQGGNRLILAVLTIGFGAICLGLAIALRSRLPVVIRSLHVLALLYGLLGLLLRIGYFSTWTGLSVLAVALLSLEVSRQTGWRWLRWLALTGITLGWYELMIYRLSLASGEHPADGLVVLAAVAAVIMGVYRLGAAWLEARLALPEAELIATAHIHWGVATVLMVLSGGLVYDSGLGLLWSGLGLGLVLVLYALLQGRGGADLWVYAGLTELVGWFVYLRLALPELNYMDDWWGVVACGFAAIFYWLPWQRMGWRRSPWQRSAIALPLVITLLIGASDHLPTLWVLAVLYGLLAWSVGRVRLSYFSAACIVWAIWLWLENRGISDSLAFVLPLGAVGLYITQLDPGLRTEANREGRHWLRVFSLGLVLVVALIEEPWTGWPLGLACLGAIAAGLGLRVRAYLYVGTVVFGLNAVNQLVWLNAEYPLIKWVVGILVGVGLIWVAADFERRREQWLGFTQTWLDQLQAWQ